MGYSRFDKNEEYIMEGMLNLKTLKKDSKEVSDYRPMIKSLLRKKMIKSERGHYKITDRGRSAITQQIRSGEYWVSPLKPKKWEPYGKLKISKELKGYVK